MQWLAELSVKRNILAAVIVLILCVAGVYSYFQLSVDQFPNVDIPMVTVTTNLTGASPEEMDTAVTDQIEKQVNTVSGIDELSSESSQGVSTVTISFVLDKNIDAAFSDVQSKVNAAVANLPTDAKTPTISKIDTGASAVYTLALTSPTASIRELSEYADKTLRPQLESLPGVGQASLVGDQLRQINILLDPYKLRAHGLTAVGVITSIENQNVELPGGNLKSDGREISLRTQGQYKKISDLDNIVVSQNNGHLVRVRDIGHVDDGSADATSLARYNGQRAVMVKIVKQSGYNTVTLVDAIKARLQDIRPNLPSSYHLEASHDGSLYIRASVKTAEEHFVLGALFAALVVLIFLRDWRSTFIAALAIPGSIIATFTLIWSQGFTLNSITLLAITLCIGIVIDDAILVLENIFRYIKEKGYSARDASIEATREIGFAVLATTLSLVAIFLPVGFMSGMIGRILKSFGDTMACAIIISLIVAFTLTPMLASRWLKYDPPEKSDDKETTAQTGQQSPEKEVETQERKGFFHKIEQVYHDTLAWCLVHRAIVIIVSVAVMLMTIPLLIVINKEFSPTDDQGSFDIDVRLPAGASLEKTTNTLESIAAEVRKLPDIENTVATAGSDTQQTAYKGTISVSMPRVADRKTGITETQAMQMAHDKILSHYSSDIVASVKAADMMGSGTQSDVQYVINGPDEDVLVAAANKMMAAIRKNKDVADVDSSGADSGPEKRLIIDRGRAGDLDVSAEDIAETAQIAVAGKKISTIDDGAYRYDIYLRGMPQYRKTTDMVNLFSVPSSKSSVLSVPLNQVASFEDRTSPTTVSRYARNHSVTISVDDKPGTSQSTVQAVVAKSFADLHLPSQYKGSYTGMSKNQGEIFTGFITVLILAVIVIYLILAAQFESWLHPITILMVLPLTVPFALLSSWLMGGSLNLYSLLGILVLFGVVKKNSILQVDHSNQLREAGMERNAAVLRASRDRLRPILMTTAAFVAGMLPLVFATGEGAASNKSIGNLIVGGQILSLVLSLLAIPVFYTIADDISNGINGFKERLGKRLKRNRKGH
jgi:HAE1 family hydrophobic/amphiphilic exporter-1